jgi:hypothetical protein
MVFWPIVLDATYFFLYNVEHRNGTYRFQNLQLTTQSIYRIAYKNLLVILFTYLTLLTTPILLAKTKTKIKVKINKIKITLING